MTAGLRRGITSLTPNAVASRSRRALFYGSTQHERSYDVLLTHNKTSSWQ